MKIIKTILEQYDFDVDSGEEDDNFPDPLPEHDHDPNSMTLPNFISYLGREVWNRNKNKDHWMPSHRQTPIKWTVEVFDDLAKTFNIKEPVVVISPIPNTTTRQYVETMCAYVKKHTPPSWLHDRDSIIMDDEKNVFYMKLSDEGMAKMKSVDEGDKPSTIAQYLSKMSDPRARDLK